MRKSFFGLAFLFVVVSVFLPLRAMGVASSQVEQILNADYDEMEQPLLPEDGGCEPIEINSRLGYVWTLSDKTQAMVFLGDFSLQMAHKTLVAHDAVVWLSVVDRDGRKVKKLDVFLEGDASVVDVSGGHTSDEILYLTISTTGSLEIAGDSITRSDGSNQEIYARADKLRAVGPTKLPDDEQVVIHAAPKAGETQVKSRQPIFIRGDFIVGPKLAGSPVLIGTDGIYIMQAGETGEEAMELRAKNAVVFLKSGTMKGLGKLDGKSKTADKKKAEQAKALSQGLTPEQIQERVAELPSEDEASSKGTSAERAKQSSDVSAVYLEGDVVLIRGYRQIRADSIYYDFENGKALIVNAVARSIVPSRNVPVYVRADEIRQINEREFKATNAKMTTSEFYTPSYHVGATTVYFEDSTERVDGDQVGLVAGKFKIYNSTLNVGGVPVLYWPYTVGNFKQAETSIKSVNIGYSSDFGTMVRTRWYLLPLLGLEEPEGVNVTLKLDYLDERGPAIGVDSTYKRDDYYGLLRSYYIHDSGEDHLGGIRGDVEPPREERGRFLVRHRQYLPSDWEFTFELSYLSDRNFLEEYFRSEFEEDKEQETVLYLKKVFGDSVFSILGKWRINDFLTQTEKTPDVAFDVLGRQLCNGLVTWFSENHLGGVRRRNDEDRPWWFDLGGNTGSTDMVARFDTRHEFDMPLTLGPVKLVPFGTIRGTAWDDSVYDSGLQRYYGQIGLKGSMYQWRVYEDVESRFWDLHRMRHIMKEDFVVWAADSNVDPSEITPFDQGIETISGVDGFSFGWRNRWQTKRGEPGNQYTVDWLTLDIEAGFFNDNQTANRQNRTRGQVFSYRPENSVTSNYVSLDAKWQISDTLALIYDMIVDTNDGRMGESGLGLFVQRSPRFNFFIGHRYIGLTKSNLMACGATYRLNSKYTISLEEQFDLERGKNADLEVILVRKMPRWNFALSASIDDTEDVESINISIWPEGISEWTMGSRKFQRTMEFMPLD